MQHLPSSLMQSNNYYLIDTTNNNNNNTDLHSNTTSDTNSDCDIDIIEADCANSTQHQTSILPTITIGNLQNFVFTSHSNYNNNNNNCNNNNPSIHNNYNCDQFEANPQNSANSSLSLMSTRNNDNNNNNNNATNPNNNNNNSLGIPSFLHDLSNQSNQSIQSNISSVSSNASNLPQLPSLHLQLNTSVSSTISNPPNMLNFDSFQNIANNVNINNEANKMNIKCIPRALISHIFSFLSSVQVIRISGTCLQFYSAIKDEGAAVQKLDASFFYKIFNSPFYPMNILYFKRFKAVKHIQIITGQLQEFITHKLMQKGTRMTGTEEKKDAKDADNDDDDIQIEDKYIKHGGVGQYIELFWSCFNRLEKLELTTKVNDVQNNGFILDTMNIVSQQQIKASNFTINTLVLHNICVADKLFDMLASMKFLTRLEIVGDITFELDTFDDNSWIFNNFDRLRVNIIHIQNIKLFFRNMHFIPYLFLLLFYHKDLVSLSVEFEQSHIMEMHNLMNLNDQYIKVISQKCAAAKNIKVCH